MFNVVCVCLCELKQKLYAQMVDDSLLEYQYVFMALSIGKELEYRCTLSQIESKLVLGPYLDPIARSCKCAVYLDLAEETDIRQSANGVKTIHVTYSTERNKALSWPSFFTSSAN